MRQFIPFEDDWEALEHLSPSDLMPYQVGVPCRHELAEAQCTGPISPSTVSTSPVCAPMRCVVPAGTSNT